MKVLASILALALGLAGCAGTAAPTEAGPAAAASEQTLGSSPGTAPVQSGALPSSAPSLETEVVCEPSPTNACVGDLSAGHHTSQVFQPAISFDVPDGWSNHEDEARGYVLYAPGSRPPESEFGARNKIAILPDVASTPKACGTPGPDAGESAQDIALWMAEREHLSVTAPVPVSVGGLSGFVVDVRLAPDAPNECFPVPGVILFHGLGPSEGVDEGIVAGTVMRIYLLDHEDDVVAIEIADVSGGDRLADFASVATSVQFER